MNKNIRLRPKIKVCLKNGFTGSYRKKLMKWKCMSQISKMSKLIDRC